MIMIYITISYHTIPCHTLSYHTMPCHNHTIPYHTIPYPTLPYPYPILPYHTLPYHTLPYHNLPTIPYHTIPYQPYHTIPYLIPCHATPRHNIIPHHNLKPLTILQRIENVTKTRLHILDTNPARQDQTRGHNTTSEDSATRTLHRNTMLHHIRGPQLYQ